MCSLVRNGFPKRSPTSSADRAFWLPPTLQHAVSPDFYVQLF